MSITDEEKELMYQEFKKRMLNVLKDEVEKRASNNPIIVLEKARLHFKVKNDELRKLEKLDKYRYSTLGMNWPDWDLIRKLVCHAFGVSSVKDIPIDKQKDANDLAIELIDDVMKVNTQILKECKDRA